MNGFENRIKTFLERKRSLDEANHQFYLREIQANDNQFVIIGGKRFLNFTTYSYLGLIGHEKIDKAAKDAIDKFGSGTHGVRVLAGTTSLHVELEKRIAQYKNTDDAIAFSSGYVTNLTTISTLCGHGDEIFADVLVHASIYDGCMLSGAKFSRFKHNDLENLESMLKKSTAVGKFIVVDSVFSMDGDITPLPEIIMLAKKYNALLMVDEAHSLGVLGKTGHGILEHFGIEDGIDIQMGTLSKTIPASGGYIAANQDIIDFIRYKARAFVFSAALTPATAASAKVAFDVMEEEQWRLQNLQVNIKYYIQSLHQAGFDTGNSETAIVPIILHEEEPTLETTRLLFEEGVFIMPILPPAVPPNTARLRANVTAIHTKQDIDFMIDKLT
ncbi:MAG: aminotransferase class I/II-fold pyridoxal phosphate-dependent enzyme, partial [Caldiserica bacterium]|nr:aminotransferase class I/II-fold pyridoxal phosphate-dependent enzyme [Caldisericota bacterium]